MFGFKMFIAVGIAASLFCTLGTSQVTGQWTLDDPPDGTTGQEWTFSGTGPATSEYFMRVKKKNSMGVYVNHDRIPNVGYNPTDANGDYEETWRAGDDGDYAIVLIPKVAGTPTITKYFKVTDPVEGPGGGGPG